MKSPLCVCQRLWPLTLLALPWRGCWEHWPLPRSQPACAWWRRSVCMSRSRHYLLYSSPSHRWGHHLHPGKTNHIKMHHGWRFDSHSVHTLISWCSIKPVLWFSGVRFPHLWPRRWTQRACLWYSRTSPIPVRKPWPTNTARTFEKNNTCIPDNL